MRSTSSEPLRALALLAGAALCAWLANAGAGPGRRLNWTGRPPETNLQPVPPLNPVLPAEPQAPPPAQPRPTPAPAAPGPAPATRPAPAPVAVATPAATPAASQRFQASASSASREIDSADAWAAFQQRIPFLDARRSEEFIQEHVAGAHSLPVWEADLETRITEFEARLNPDPKSPLVLYCGGGCEDSHLLARKLMTLGYRNLLIYRDGFPDWVGQGRPRTQGARP